MGIIKTICSKNIKHLQLDIKRDEFGNVTIFAIVKSTVEDKAIKNLKPLFKTVNEELADDSLIVELLEPLERTQELIDNVREYELDREESRKKTEREKNRKLKIQEAEKALKKIIESDKFDFKKSRDIAKAKKAIGTLKELDKQNAYALKILEEVNSKSNTLFY